jgi:hypothetical protein
MQQRQKSKGKSQKAKGKRQKAKGKKIKTHENSCRSWEETNVIKKNHRRKLNKWRKLINNRKKHFSLDCELTVYFCFSLHFGDSV